MIQLVYEVCGDIIRSNCDIICIFLNRDSVINSKIFRNLKSKYPEVIESFREARKQAINKKRMGNTYKIKAYDGTIFYFININTKEKKLYTDYQKELINRSFKKVLNAACRKNLPLTIGMQKILPDDFRVERNFILLSSLIDSVFFSMYVDLFLMRPDGRI